jgi:hypothetical protein
MLFVNIGTLYIHVNNNLDGEHEHDEKGQEHFLSVQLANQ